jgi:hypothetical protein
MGRAEAGSGPRAIGTPRRTCCPGERCHLASRRILQIRKGIALRGAGHAATKLACDMTGDCIEVRGSGPGTWVSIVSGATQGSTVMVVADAGGVVAGDLIEIQQDNDFNVYHQGSENGWLEDNMVGQIVPVASVSGTTLSLGRPLYYTYNPAMNPRFVRRNFVKGAGLEKLTIERVRKVDDGYSIELIDAAHCWVTQVKSTMGARAHVGLSQSYGNEVRGSLFDNCWVDGDGGRGYGTSVAFHATDNLIEDNVFRQLRHSMIIQLGASGNVFGYNYSTEPDRSDTNPDRPTPDISVHGHYGNMNLFEGNTVQGAAIDNVWGTNGSTTLFRNRIEKLLLPGDSNPSYLTIDENNPNHNIVGNELGTANPASRATLPVDIDPSVAATIIRHGNYTYQDATVDWSPAIATRALPASYYLAQRPAFLGNGPWPVIGGDLAPNTNLIPAQARFNAGSFIPDSP